MKRLIRFYEGYIENDELWFSNLNYNALLRMNIKTGRTEFIDKFPKASLEQRNLHLRVIKYGECLYFIPFRNNIIHIWNLNKQKWEEIIKLPYADDITIEDAILQNDEIWIFPEILKNYIIKVNLMQKTVKLITELTERINAINGEAASIISCGVSKYKDLLFLSVYKKNYIMVIDFKSEKILNQYHLESISIAGIKVIEENICCIWLTNSGDILFWNIKENIIKTIPIHIKLYYERRPFQNIVKIDKNRLLLLPCHTNKILLLDILSGLVDELELPSEFKRKSAFTLFLYAQKIKNMIYLFPCGGDMLICIDVSTMSVSAMNFVMSNEFKDYACQIIEKNFREEFDSGIMLETAAWNETLSEFLNMVCQKDENDLENEVFNAGAKIYDQIQLLIN